MVMMIDDQVKPWMSLKAKRKEKENKAKDKMTSGPGTQLPSFAKGLSGLP